MRHVIVGGAVAALAAAVHAQEPMLLPEVVVTAGRTPVAVEEVGRSFTVITADQLERRQTRFVSEALRTVPGLAVSRSGGPGGLTAVRVRGAEATHVLVLIDGIEAAQPVDGVFDFGGLLASQVERVEVLRGPQSALYGSNAAAGVINVITKAGARRSGELGGRVEIGTDETLGGEAFLGGGTARAAFALGAGLRESGGFDVSDDPGGGDDGDRNATFNGRAEGDLTETLTLSATARLTDRRSDFDDFVFGAVDRDALVVDADNQIEERSFFGGLGAEWRTFGGALVHAPRLEYTDVRNQSVEGGLDAFGSDGDRLHASWQSTLFFDALGAEHGLTGAVEYENEETRQLPTDVFFQDPSQLAAVDRDLYGVVGEYRGTFFDALSVQAALRHDLNDDFEDATTYSASVSYDLAATGSRLHASVGTGVVNPTFFEQFGFIPDSFEGNPDLEPVETFGFDVGIEQRLWDDRVVADATYFNETLDNEIATVFAEDFSSTTVVNEDGESDRQGVELSLSAFPTDALTVTASYTYVLAEDPDDRQEVRRPRHLGALVANHRFLGDRVNLNLALLYQGDRRDTDFTAASFGADRTTLDDYVRVDVAGGYRVTDRAELYARIDNLTDAEFEEVQGFRAQGTTGFVGVRAAF